MKIKRQSKNPVKKLYTATVLLTLSAKTRDDLEVEIKKINAYAAGKAIILVAD